MSNSIPPPPSSARPIRITLLALLVLTITAWNLIRLATSLAWGEAFQTYAAHPGRIYIGLTGAIWTLAGAMILRAIWRRSRWALEALTIAGYLYAAWSWFDRLVLQTSIPSNWLFALIVTVALLGFATGIALDPRSRAYFGKEAHGRKIQKPTSS